MATSVIDTAFHLESSTSPTRCAAHQLEEAQRQRLAIDILAGNGSVTELAERHQVSRKFLYQQADKGEQALTQVFSPPPPAEEKVLFYLPVTKAWLRQVVLALVLLCHSSFTFSCAVISARPAFRCCAFSSTIVLICAALSLNAAAKHRHNCSPAKPTRTGWRCSAFSAFAAWQPKHGRPFVVVTGSVSA
jgi:hypothetical protein